MIPAITSKTFVLRPVRKSDEKSLQKNINHRDIYRYTLHIPYPYTSKDARKWIAKTLSFYRKKTPAEINFAIDIAGEVVGAVGLTKVEGHRAELGYWLAKKHWGRGIMTQAVRLVCRFGFKQLQLRRIYAEVFAENKASARVLEKNGFKREGMMRKLHKKKGRFVDALMYAKVR